MKTLGAFLLVALFVGAGIRANDAASAQQRLAEEWSGESVRFVAVGLTGSTLHAKSQVECDAMVDAIRTDSKLVGELRQANFRSVECGQVRGDLR